MMNCRSGKNPAVMNKQELRKHVCFLKNELSDKEKADRSENIFLQVEKTDFFRNARYILIYWAMADEVQTRNFILKWRDEKQIMLPCVNGWHMAMKKFTGEEDLVEGKLFRILEPDGPEFPEPEKIDLVIVPGIAFDRNNNRMGRGKGYYDRFLSATKAKKVGVCWNFQLFDEVPTDPHDIKMDQVITG